MVKKYYILEYFLLCNYDSNEYLPQVPVSLGQKLTRVFATDLELRQLTTKGSTLFTSYVPKNIQKKPIIIKKIVYTTWNWVLV